MSKMKDYMMDVEEFCNGYYYGGMKDFPLDEVIEDVDMYFKSDIATKYARQYLTEQKGARRAQRDRHRRRRRSNNVVVGLGKL